MNKQREPICKKKERGNGKYLVSPIRKIKRIYGDHGHVVDFTWKFFCISLHTTKGNANVGMQWGKNVSLEMTR